MRKNFYEVFGYTNPMECMTLQRFGLNGSCLEIGAFYGKSTVAMAEVAMIVYTVDTFKSDKMGERQLDVITTYDQFIQNIKGYDNIVIVEGMSYDVVPKIQLKFDLVFLDGLHTYENTAMDIRICWPKLKRGGTMALHDYGFYKHPGCKEAFNELLGEPEGIQDTVAWVTKRRTSL